MAFPVAFVFGSPPLPLVLACTSSFIPLSLIFTGNVQARKWWVCLRAGTFGESPEHTPPCVSNACASLCSLITHYKTHVAQEWGETMQAGLVPTDVVLFESNVR